MSPNGKSHHTKKVSATRAPGLAAARQEHPLSTDVSSPVQSTSKRRNPQRAQAQPRSDLRTNEYSQDDFVRSDNENECNEFDDQSERDFELIGEFEEIGRSRKRPIGPPITTDDKFEKLNPVHQMIVVDFMHAAIILSRKVVPLCFLSTNYRLRQMNSYFTDYVGQRSTSQPIY